MSQNHRQVTRLTLLSTLILALSLGFFACSNKEARAKLNFVFKDNANQEIAAKVAGKDVSHADLRDRAKLRIVELEKQIYKLKLQELNNLTREHVLKTRAEEAKMPVEDFVNKKVVRGKVKVTERDFKEFVESRGRSLENIDAALKQRIFKFLEEKKKDDKIEAYVASWTRKNPVEVYFKRPVVKIDVEVGKAPVWGNSNAPITIVEFSDFQCPFCSRANDTLTKLKKKYKGKIKIAYKHFPLPNHKDALPAAAASMCVHEQNAKKFWPYHDMLFKNPRGLDTESLVKMAKKVGVNEGKFKECFEGKKYESFVQEDITYGNKVGVESTPTFFINGEMVAGAQAQETFEEIIDAQLTASKKL